MGGCGVPVQNNLGHKEKPMRDMTGPSSLILYCTTILSQKRVGRERKGGRRALKQLKIQEHVSGKDSMVLRPWAKYREWFSLGFQVKEDDSVSSTERKRDRERET